MIANAFIDTNVLVYAHTDMDTIKQIIAQNVMSDDTIKTFVSTQVLNELANTLNRKFKQGWLDVERVLSDVSENNNVYTNDVDAIIKSCQIAKRYSFSFYDSLIITASLECDCSILYSEDLHDGQIIENKLRIVNPFKQSKAPA